MDQTVVAIRPASTDSSESKTVAGNQKAIDALPLNSGTWRVEGVPGLYVRARAQSRSYMVLRRVKGVLVKRTLGEMTLKAARAEAMRLWARLKPMPVAHGRKTFEAAFDEFIAQRDLADKTREIYRYNLDRYLGDWKGRALDAIGNDRAAVRALYHSVVKQYGKASAAQVIRMLSAVYRHARRVDAELPETPTIAVNLPVLKSRDWAMSGEPLVVWWKAVDALKPVKKMWWITALLTGARRASIEALKWADIDLSKKTIRFRVTKGDRPYLVPAADRLIRQLIAYRDSGDVPPSEWVFPSGDGHLTNVRDDKRGVTSAHHCRHTFRTTLAELGATSDQARLLMGHSLGRDVSTNYITGTAPLLLESLRPLANAVAEQYAQLLSW